MREEREDPGSKTKRTDAKRLVRFKLFGTNRCLQIVVQWNQGTINNASHAVTEVSAPPAAWQQATYHQIEKANGK